MRTVIDCCPPSSTALAVRAKNRCDRSSSVSVTVAGAPALTSPVCTQRPSVTSSSASTMSLSTPYSLRTLRVSPAAKTNSPA